MKLLYALLALLGLSALLCAPVAQAYDKAVVEEMLAAQEQIAGLSRHEASIEGQRIVYLDNGRDKATDAVMFVHGFGDSSLSWTFFARMFRGMEQRLIIPDLLGFGRSARPLAADYSYAAQSQRLFALLSSLGVKRVHLVGNSMGGGIAAQLAIAHPDRVASLTLMDAAGVHYKSTVLDEQILKGDNFLVPEKPEDFPRLLSFATYTRPLSPQPIMDYLAERAVQDHALHTQIFNKVLLADINFLLLDLDRIKAPTLIVWGQHDQVLSPENARVFQKFIAGSQVKTFANAGHMPMLEIPEESGLVVRQFIEAHGGKARP